MTLSIGSCRRKKIAVNLKFMKKVLIILLCFTFFYACDSNDAIKKENSITKEELLVVKNQLIDNLNALGDQLRENNSDFCDQSMVRAIVENQASHSDINLSEFDRVTQRINPNNKVKREVAVQKCVTPYQASLISEIDQKANESETPIEFNNLLEELEEKILNDNMTELEKRPILLLIKSQQASIEFIDNNQDLFRKQVTGVKSGGWWQSWGKCAASIVGGAVTGATTLGLAGAAVGTVALPIVGTVGGGVVGVIGGAIGGGLTGAVAGCGGNKGEGAQKHPDQGKLDEIECNDCNTSRIFAELCIEEKIVIN